MIDEKNAADFRHSGQFWIGKLLTKFSLPKKNRLIEGIEVAFCKVFASVSISLKSFLSFPWSIQTSHNLFAKKNASN